MSQLPDEYYFVDFGSFFLTPYEVGQETVGLGLDRSHFDGLSHIKVDGMSGGHNSGGCFPKKAQKKTIFPWKTP